MFEQFLNFYKGLDESLFVKINRDWAFDLGDKYFPAVTDFHQSPIFLYAVLPLLLIGVLYKFRTRGIKYILTLALCLVLTDAVCFRVLKQAIQRPRPAHAGVAVVLRVEDSGGTSFPSNHSANIFATAAVTTFFFPEMSALIYLYAFSIAYSRVYVGVHYPSDVVAGALLGSFIAFIILKFFGGFLKKREEIPIEGKFDIKTRKQKKA